MKKPLLLILRKVFRVLNSSTSDKIYSIEKTLESLLDKVNMLDLRSSAVERHLDNPDSDFRRARASLRLLAPISSGHTFKRAGGVGDGGYIVPADLSLPDKVISIGIGNDDRCDLEYANSGVPVYQFDHTISHSPSESHPNITFTPIGIGVRADNGAAVQSLGNLIELTHASHQERLWLFIDVEGAEWESLTLEPLSWARFEVISIELHGLFGLLDPRFGPKIDEAIRSLTKSHTVVHTSVNNFGLATSLVNSVLPNVVESTLIRNDVFKAGNFQVPDLLSEPNTVSRPSIPAHTIGSQESGRDYISQRIAQDLRLLPYLKSFP